MRDHDAEDLKDVETDLDSLLRNAAPPSLTPRQQQAAYTHAWDSVTTAMINTPATPASTRAATAPSTSTAAPAGTAHEQAARRARRLDVVTAQQVHARRHRRLARAGAITLAVALAGTGTAAAATYLATRTGQQSAGWEATAAGPGELLRQDGSDYLDVAHQLSADIPFAPTHQAQRQAQFSTGMLAPQADGQISTSALRAQVAQNAICTWADAWIAADTTGDSTDSTARQTAGDTLTASLTWTAVTDVDPHPSPTGALGDQGAQAETRFGWVPAIAAAAATGDHRAVLDAVTDSGRCDPQLTPALNADPAYQGPTR
ncbi:hypothetical protein [Kineococcus esterisolvens]|uniref:hypothetical protein n=1 Tax=unclassified Kineococcus TaxID=2621656 RepID=UPI003D7EE0F6